MILFAALRGGTFPLFAMKNIDRRESPRIDIQLRCHITSPALWLDAAMYTENLSRSGISIAWCGPNGPLEPPATGQILTVEVELPAHHDFGQKCMHCEGTVTRVTQPEGGYPRVAMEINYVDFRSFQDRIRTVKSLYPSVSNWSA